MNFADTPGARLRYFADNCFKTITEFSDKLGYAKPGTVYSYFKGAKQPGKTFLKRLYRVGGNPDWVRSGDGSIFADNDAGHALQARFEEPVQSLDIKALSSYNPGEYGEILFLLANQIFYKITNAPQVAPGTLLMCRDMLVRAQHELEARAQYRWQQ